MNIEALKQALEDVLNSCMLTANCDGEVRRFLQDGNLDAFSDGSRKELSLLYSNIILPSYQRHSGGNFIPNIFAQLEEE